MRGALYASGGAHVAVIVMAALVGDVGQAPPEPEMEITEITIFSDAEFETLFNPAVNDTVIEPAPVAAPVPQAQPEPTPPPSQQPMPEPALTPPPVRVFVPPPAADTARAPAPAQPAPASPVDVAVADVFSPPRAGAPDLPSSPRPAPRAAPRVAPQAAPPPPPDIDTSPQVIDQVTNDAPADDTAPPTALAAPQEATTEIVTEADQPAGSNAPSTSARPASRPRSVAATPPADPSPDDDATAQALADAVANTMQDALSDASQTPTAPLSPLVQTRFRRAVAACWNIGALSSQAQAAIVTLRFDMQRDGRPVASSIRMVDFTGATRGPAEQAFEAARRAILRCGENGYALPSAAYDQWADVQMVFNPADLRLR